MSTTHTNLEFKRFVRQVTTGPSAVVQAAAMAEQNLNNLKLAAWTPSDEIDAAIPPINFDSNPILPGYDAYKLITDYVDGTGKANAYAGMVAYRLQLPADALAATVANITKVEVPLYVDRWLVGGVRLAVILSDNDTPPIDWTTLREGDAYVSAQLDTQDPRVDQNAIIEITVSSEPSKTYLYIIETLEDYPSVSPVKDSRIEGGAMIIGQTIITTFDRSVTADTVDTLIFEIDYAGESFTENIHIDIFDNQFYNNSVATLQLVPSGDIYPQQLRATLISGEIPTGDFWAFAFVDATENGVYAAGGICGVHHNAPAAAQSTDTLISLNLHPENIIYRSVTDPTAVTDQDLVTIAEQPHNYPVFHWGPVSDSAYKGIYSHNNQYTVRLRNTGSGSTRIFQRYEQMISVNDAPILNRQYMHIGDLLNSQSALIAAYHLSLEYGHPGGNFEIQISSGEYTTTPGDLFSSSTYAVSTASMTLTYNTPTVESVNETYLSRPLIKFSTPTPNFSMVEIDIWTDEATPVQVSGYPLLRVVPPLHRGGTYNVRVPAALADDDYKVKVRVLNNASTAGTTTLNYSTASAFKTFTIAT